MRKILKKLSKIAISFAMTLIVVVVGIFPATISVLAQGRDVAYEQTNVMDDLKGAVINGKSFSLTDYAFDKNKQTQVLAFIEYCYSFHQNQQDNYGLYIYVYNPQGKRFVVDHPLNQIQLACGSVNQSYKKYQLAFLNYSTERNFERLFYKFKIVLNSEQHTEILKLLNVDDRIYRVSGVELLEEGKTNATEYAVGTTYHFRGYAKGYGKDANSSDSLLSTSEKGEVLRLNVFPTVYRPQGSNGKSEWHQDSLHSVYFAVPNAVIERYGEMKAIHATWLNAVLKPVLVTGNYDAYSAILEYLGERLPTTDTGIHTDDLYYMYYGACTGAGSGFSNATCYYGYSYNAMTKWSGHTMLHSYYGEEVNPLYTMYYSGSGKDSADTYTVSSSQILAKLKDSAMEYGGDLVNGKYSRKVFESIDSKPIDVNVQAEESYSLTEQKIDKAWWNGLFGVSRPDKVTTTVFDNIKAIYAVREADFTGTMEEIVKRLYISEADYEDFYAYYQAKKKENTIYLFRYQTSDYIAQEATLYEYYPDGSIFTTGVGWQKCDTNAYFFQETVSLDFDIIDITFSDGVVSTIISVVSNPIDIAPEATAPLYTQSDKESSFLKWLKIVIGVILLIIVLRIFLPFYQPILLFVARGILRGVAWICKRIGRLFKKRNDRDKQ